MSGPIVRKYGFPNFEKIFGERPLEHGVDSSEAAEPETPKAKKSAPKEKPPKSPAKATKSKPKAK